MSNAREAAGALLDVLFPGTCLLCGRDLGCLATPSRHPVCSGCLVGIRPIDGPRCRACGAAIVSEQEVCGRCRERSFHFESAWPLFEYAGAVRELVYLYKFEGRRRIGRLFAEWVAEALARTWPGLPVVPVPGRPSVLRRRGWEHMQEIARVLRRLHGVPVLRCLSRRGGGEQKGLDFAARSANMRGRILFRGAGLAAGTEAVLLDDVLTTGATADECARVLRARGAGRVYLLTLAID